MDVLAWDIHLFSFKFTKHRQTPSHCFPTCVTDTVNMVLHNLIQSAVQKHKRVSILYVLVHNP